MTSFLIAKKDKKSYDEKLSSAPESTKRNKMLAVKTFERFYQEKYQKSSTIIIDEIIRIKKTESEEYEDILYGILQEWINWNKKRGIGNYTIRTQFSNLRKYLFYRKIKTDEQDIKEYLTFEKISREERYPLSLDEYRKIIDGFSKYPHTQALFLALGSSGMRIGEALSLKKKDLDFTKERIKVNIPPTTKTRTGRTTYLSRETEKILKPLLENKNSENYVFARNDKKPNDRSIRMSLHRILMRMGSTEKYESNRRMKITSHSFRAYFFTKSARKHGENYAHRMTGHGGYLMQYDRMTEDEKLEMYLQLEPELAVFEQTKNELEIKRLREKVEEIDELKQEVQKLREAQAKADKKTIDLLKKQRVFTEKQKPWDERI